MTDRVLFSINHPAQVHLFKHAIWELQSRGVETLVASRDKEMTVDLLDEYDIEHHPLTAEGDGTVSLATELARREVGLYRLGKQFDPDVVVSRLSPPAVHVSSLIGSRNLVYTDTILRPWPVRAVYHGVTLPLVDDLCVPPGFDLQVSAKRRHEVSFQELAYLHPDRFEPDPERLRRHGATPEDTYFVLRLAGWDAYHDVGNRGISREHRWNIVDYLAERGRVYITSEAELPSEYEQYRLTVPPHCIHDLLYFADLYLGDSQTMPTEAALLGTPAVRINSVAGDDEMHNFQELAEHGLLFSYSDEKMAFERVRSIVRNDRSDQWEARRTGLVEQKRDVTDEMVSLVLNGPVDTRSGGDGEPIAVDPTT